MAIANKLRKGLDKKVWQAMAPCLSSAVTGMPVVSDPAGVEPNTMFIATVSSVYFYNNLEDAWLELPASGMSGTLGAGSCGAYHPYGPNGTATAGTTTTLTTNLTINRSVAGYRIRILTGPGAGDERVIASNTFGANSVITVTVPFSATITSSSTYVLLTGRYWFLNAGTLASGYFGYYDLALSTWTTNKSVTNLMASLGTDGKLIATSNANGSPFATGTATAGGAATLTNSGKSWTVNQWTNYQVRITGGTGAGQIRTIASNTSTALTVSQNWTTQPDNTSVYAIEGCDNFLYFLGNNAVTLYRYEIFGAAGLAGAAFSATAANTWASMSPSVARSAAIAISGTADWVWNATDAAWTDESVIQNGRYIYSHRGSGSTYWDRYDIPTGNWSVLSLGNHVAGGAGTLTLTTSTLHAAWKNGIYFQKDTTGRVYRLDVTKGLLEGYSTSTFPQSTGYVGNRMWVWKYTSDGDELPFIYFISPALTYVQRTALLLD